MINFAIGTAQFGQTYGIKNQNGAVTGKTAEEIVQGALENAISTFDTARLYGQSEEVLGSTLELIAPQDKTRIITKYYANENNPEQLRTDFLESMEKLKGFSIDTLLIHNSDSLSSSNAEKIWTALEEIKKEHNINKIGVSVYTPEDFIALAERFPIQIVQAPCNLFDQRFLDGNVQEIRHKRNIEFHARSLFLQGLLLDPTTELPERFQAHNSVFKKREEYASRVGASLMQLCLLYAQYTQRNKLIDQWVIGVYSKEQLLEIVDCTNSIGTLAELNEQQARSLSTDNLEIIDPRTWNK